MYGSGIWWIVLDRDRYMKDIATSTEVRPGNYVDGVLWTLRLDYAYRISTMEEALDHAIECRRRGFDAARATKITLEVEPLDINDHLRRMAVTGGQWEGPPK